MQYNIYTYVAIHHLIICCHKTSYLLPNNILFVAIQHLICCHIISYVAIEHHFVAIEHQICCHRTSNLLPNNILFVAIQHLYVSLQPLICCHTKSYLLTYTCSLMCCHTPYYCHTSSYWLLFNIQLKPYKILFVTNQHLSSCHATSELLKYTNSLIC